MPSFEWAHRNTIQPMSLQMNVGDVVRIHPRTPLSEVEASHDWLAKAPVSETVEIIEMRVTQPRPGVRSVEPLNDRSKRLIERWTKKYGSMSDADFDWLPSL